MIFIIIFFSNGVAAQFTDSTTKYVKLSSGGSINKTSKGSNYLFNNLAQFNVKKKKTALNSTVSYIYGMTPEKLTNNDLILSSNLNLFRHFKEFYYWGLLNYNRIYSLNIKAQGQAGLGIAYNFFNKENIWLNVSNGIIFETSRIVLGDSSLVDYQTIRNSLRMQFTYNMPNKFSFRTSNFFQPSFEYISDHTIFSDSELNYQLWKGINLNMRLLYNKISRTKKENLIFTYGLTYQRYF